MALEYTWNRGRIETDWHMLLGGLVFRVTGCCGIRIGLDACSRLTEF